MNIFQIEKTGALTREAQLVGALSYKLVGHRFDCWPGHRPGLQVRPQSGRVCETQPMDVSLLSPPPSPSKHVLK